MLIFGQIAFLGLAVAAVIVTSKHLAKNGAAMGLVARRDLAVGKLIPTAGGLGFLPALVGVIWLEFGTSPMSLMMIGGAVLLAVVGFVDDVVDLSPGMKLGAEVAICAPVVWALVAALTPVAAALYLLLVVGTINLVNFSDNMDGLAATLTATTAAGVVACLAIAWGGMLELVLMAAVVIAVCAGFMAHNRPPARVHMGDTGSMSLGFVLAILLVALAGHLELDRGPAAVSAVGLLLGLMLLDGVQVIAARAIIRRPLMPGDRRHLSHRLLKIVGSKWKTLGLLWVVHAVFVAGAVVVCWRPEIWAIVVAPLVIGGVALVAWLWRVPGDEYPGFSG